MEIEVKTLKIDEEWSIVYDPDNNDRPLGFQRYGESYRLYWDYNNAVTAMFYALLEARGQS